MVEKNLAHKFTWVKYFEHLNFPHPTFSEMLWKDWMAIWHTLRYVGRWHLDFVRGFSSDTRGIYHKSQSIPLHSIWLVVYLPLWKMMEFVTWDHEIPNCFWKVIQNSMVPVTTKQFSINHIHICWWNSMNHFFGFLPPPQRQRDLRNPGRPRRRNHAHAVVPTVLQDSCRWWHHQWGTQNQWDFQDPIDWRYRFHIFLAYVLGLFFREHPHNSYGQKYGTNVPPF